ncbi:MAG: metallophosphoesterase [Clostridia bacterium]|nr:metallophosphoesterase [Clostridia bacterium]
MNTVCNCTVYAVHSFILFHNNSPFLCVCNNIISHLSIIIRKDGVLLNNLFAISDLHLSFGSNKPMDIFPGWENHTERIKANWKRMIDDNDTVVISGDISWGMTLKESEPDFDFLHTLPGKKVIIKGNHDYWWSTVTKINNFLRSKEYEDFFVLYNNSYSIGEYAVCGSRSWEYDAKQSDENIVARECGRIEASIISAIRSGKKPILFLHYPPAFGTFLQEPVLEVIKKYNIDKVYYGHIHGLGNQNAVKEINKVALFNISCDYLDFTPKFICKY